MINGLKPDISTFGIERSPRGADNRPETSSADRSFADRLTKDAAGFSKPAADSKPAKGKFDYRRKSDDSNKKDSNDSANAYASSNASQQTPVREQRADNSSSKDSNSEVKVDAAKASEKPAASSKMEKGVSDKSSDKASATVGEKQSDEVGKKAAPVASTEMTLAGLIDMVAKKADQSSNGPKIDPEVLDLLQSFKAEQATVKEIGVQQFMSRMNEAFGIEPDEIVAAFATLDPKALLATPQESKAAFLDNLGIDEEDMPLAEEMYDQLVQVTGQAEANEKFSELDGVNFEVMSAKEAGAKKLNEGLNRMNGDFFGPSSRANAKQAVAGEDLASQIARLKQERGGDQKVQNPEQVQTQMLAANMIEDESLETLADSQEFAPFETSVLKSDKLSSGLEGMSAAGAASSFGSAMNQQSGEGSSNLSGSSQQNLMGQVKNSGQNQTTDQAAKAAGKKFSVETSKADVKEDSANANPLTGASNQQTPVDKKPVIGPTAMIIDPKATAKDDALNVKELIKQAQVMLRKGGGEMKLEMSPEGMGKVHLKVSVENGNVNLQMVTESDAAKKMLENGLHELKAGLAAHKLHVERAQIEIGNEIQKQLDQQASQEQARQQARQSAMDFMGGFRENNEGFRQMFTGDNLGRGYGRPERRGNMQPEPVISSASAQRTYGRSSGGGRLNLVA